MKIILLHNAHIVTGKGVENGSILIKDDRIADICYGEELWAFKNQVIADYPEAEIKDLAGKHIFAGGVDAHVHFREPGLTHKADIESESKAALAGGVTTVFDMPNTKPATTSFETLNDKYHNAEGKSFVNIGFHIGVTNTNYDEIIKSLGKAAGIKVFMGSSTGNMLVDDADTLQNIFKISDKQIMVHCEDETTIKEGLETALQRYGEDIPWEEHKNIRSRKACIKATIKALELAIRFQSKLTVCHISTMEEIEMVRAAKLNNSGIYGETSINYLWFCDKDYASLGSRIKCNPSIKLESDRSALIEALKNGDIDIIGSDHAPHLESEKEGKYCSVPSGIPSIQQSLPVLLTIARSEDIPLNRIASVFSEKAAEIYGLQRGRIQRNFFADLVIVDIEKEFTVHNNKQFSKCGWTPYEGCSLYGKIEMVYINGNPAYKDDEIISTPYGKTI